MRVVVAKALRAVLLGSLVVVRTVPVRVGRIGRSGLERISSEPSKRDKIPSSWASSLNCRNQGTHLACPLRMWLGSPVLLFCAFDIVTMVDSIIRTKSTASNLSIGLARVPDQSKKLTRE